MEIHPDNQKIQSLDDAMKMTREIYEYAKVTPEEMSTFVKKGTVGPSFAKARQIAESFPKLFEFAHLILDRETSNGKTLKELAVSGEALLLFLCFDMQLGKPSEIRPEAIARMPLSPESKAKQAQSQRTEIKMPAKKWWEFWK